MNDIKFFYLFNPEYKDVPISEVRQEHQKCISSKKSNKVYSIESFFRKYPNFNIDTYKKETDEIKNLSTINVLAHYHISQINNQIIPINAPLQNAPIKDCTESFSTKKLAHIFIHFFEIGGGERYLSNFNRFNNLFDETLFINKNYSNKTLYNIPIKTIIYDSYEELNILLKEFDIIIDHQTYWFEIGIHNKIFADIQYEKIIRITHGVPIHYNNIDDRNYYFSIELYNEKLSHLSWNNHIKYYNNIGVKLQNYKHHKAPDFENINIAIVGRINSEKLPKDFMNYLSKFTMNLSNNNYTFNFYGICDKSYEKYFLNYVHDAPKIIYHGLVLPDDVENIYLNNDILLHPSKSEAGATVILEAMSYGLPVICRNSGGIPNATQYYEVFHKGMNVSTDLYNNFLCNTDSEFFSKLLKINNHNYNEISVQNILKIEKYNDENSTWPCLMNDIKLIYDNHILSYGQIPNTIHYIFGLKPQTEEFLFTYYLSILSNVVINKPNIIYFHYQYEPFGNWWDEAKKYLKLNYVNATNMYWNKKQITKVAHKADKMRLEILYKYGGIYMDIDTITYRPYNDLLKNNLVIGIQEENYGDDKTTLYCNAIIFAKKENAFIKEWINRYESAFEPSGWCEASVHLPHKILCDNSYDITILEKECFYYPSYNEVDKIFENEYETHDKLITLHLWNTFSYKYLNQIKDFNWANNNKSLFSKLMKNLITITITNT